MDEERKRLDTLIETKLYVIVKDIFQNRLMNALDKEKAEQKAVEKFCEVFEITDDEDIIHIFEKLEKMRLNEEQMKEEKQRYDEEAR